LHIQKCPQLENVGLVMHDHHTFDLVDQENSRPLHALRHYDGMTGTIMSPLDWEKALDRQIQGSRSIPAELKQYLTSPCPFSSGKKVADSHLLVFVPGQISTEGSQRRPFSLEVLKGLAMYSEFSEPVDDIRNDGVGYWIAVGPRDLFEIEFHFEKWCQGEVFTDGNWQKSLVANFPETQHLRRAYSLPNSLEAFAILITLFRCGMHSEFKRQGPDFSYLVNEIVSSDKWRGQTDKRYFVAPKNDESVRRCFLKGEYRLESIATKQSTRNEGRGLVVPVRRWQVDH